MMNHPAGPAKANKGKQKPGAAVIDLDHWEKKQPVQRHDQSKMMNHPAGPAKANNGKQKPGAAVIDLDHWEKKQPV